MFSIVNSVLHMYNLANYVRILTIFLQKQTFIKVLIGRLKK